MRWLLVFLWLASPSMAQTIAVASGEHAGYSRLVLSLPPETDWQVGRTETGYELALPGSDPRFDVSRVFDLIPKTRLTGIFADPVTGRLQLAVSCLCHALPFQLDARTLVIDLRDGAPPPASSFEAALDGRVLPPLAEAQTPRPRPRPGLLTEEAGPVVPTAPPLPEYDWLALRRSALPTDATFAPASGPWQAPAADLSPVRESLIRQLSRGAADGIIELALPEARGDLRLPGSPQLRVTRLPGFGVHEDRPGIGEVKPDGAACVPDTALALMDWGGEGDAAMQIATARAALVGEFDKPDQAAVSRAVRTLLHLGFGAEAEMTIAAFGATDADVPIWISLARVIDDRPQAAETPFSGMAGCDTAAALWSVMSVPPGMQDGAINTEAVQRAFSDMPAGLRQHLAPRIAERALATGAKDLAHAILAATRRAGGSPGGMDALLQARLDLTEGRTAEAAEAMERLLAAGGPTAADALILLIDARVARAEPLSAEIPAVAAAMLREHAGTSREAALLRGWQLSLAATGDFDAAFAAAPGLTDLPEIWRLLAHLGTDTAVLSHGILPPQPPVIADREVSILMAQRLLRLGFAEAAGQWLGAVTPEATVADRILRAQIDLARGDGRAVLSGLAGNRSPEAMALKASAEEALGQPAMARVTWSAAGDPVASVRAAGWARQWDDVAEGPEGVWRAAALAAAIPVPNDEGGPLAQGKALVEDSVTLRADLDRLLATVPQP